MTASTIPNTSPQSPAADTHPGHQTPGSETPEVQSAGASRPAPAGTSEPARMKLQKRQRPTTQSTPRTSTRPGPLNPHRPAAETHPPEPASRVESLQVAQPRHFHPGGSPYMPIARKMGGIAVLGPGRAYPRVHPGVHSSQWNSKPPEIVRQPDQPHQISEPALPTSSPNVKPPGMNPHPAGPEPAARTSNHQG